MGKIKTSNQTCSKCFNQIQGNKTCYCSINFSNKKATGKKVADKEVKIRRTDRIKRCKPNYYDALEYDRQAHKEKCQRAKAKLILNKVLKTDKTIKDLDDGCKRIGVQLNEKKSKNEKMEAIEEIKHLKEEDLEEIVLSEETTAKFDLILQDINRKIYASSWRIYT